MILDKNLNVKVNNILNKLLKRGDTMSVYKDLKGMIEKDLYSNAMEMQEKLDYFYQKRKKITLEQYQELTALLEKKELEKIEGVAAQ